MAVINEASVIDQFSEVIPSAAVHGEAYLRAVARGIQEQAPPVTMSVEAISASRAFATGNAPFLVVTPTSRRLRHYKTLHYGVPVGVNLKVGWYLIGGDKAEGVGFMGIGSASVQDVSDVETLVKIIHEFAVAPALHQTAAVAGRGPGVGQGSAGFFGA